MVSPADLTAQWDLYPAHFYLAYDGNDPDFHQVDQFALIEADVADVHGKLTYHSNRDKGILVPLSGLPRPIRKKPRA